MVSKHCISENGYIESFNGKMRDELLNREIFYTLLEAQVFVENWRREYNTIKPHSYRPPAPETRELTLTLQLVQYPAGSAVLIIMIAMSSELQ